MPTLFNKPYTPAELQLMTGCMDQLAGIRLFEYSDGKMRGMRAAEVWTGSGLRFTVLFDRGMDIGPADFCGTPLAWTYPTLSIPAYYEPVGGGFGRTFGGGLVVTCGMNHFGPAEQEGDTFFPQHGRISHIPAEKINTFCGWVGDTYKLEISGEVHQTRVFGENLVLSRRIFTTLGASSLHIEDTITNASFRPVTHMLLYHCNFGFPAVSPHSTLTVDENSVVARDEEAKKGLGKQNTFELPDPNYCEQVFFHKLNPAQDGFATAKLWNPDIHFGAFIRYRLAELPILAQWKMMGAGEYLCGLEPCTNAEAPRAELRKRSELRTLVAGEEVHYALEIGAIRE